MVRNINGEIYRSLAVLQLQGAVCHRKSVKPGTGI